MHRAACLDVVAPWNLQQKKWTGEIMTYINSQKDIKRDVILSYY
jgi:hypothetical protein